MNKITLALLGIVFSVATFASAFGQSQNPPREMSTCGVQVPYGAPSVKAGTTVVCRSAYIIDHDPVAKIPHWVAWTLTPDHAIGCAPRVNAFATDLSLPNGQRATPNDYAGTGYDQGHLANNADLSWNADVARESFLMSNMSPQLPSVNRGTWKNLESAGRAWVYQTKQTHTFYAGNVWSANSKTIGANKVVVPDALYKIVINHGTGKSYAFLFPHRNGLDPDFTKYQVTVSDIEQFAATSFPVPDAKNIRNPVPAADLKKIADDKKKVCKD
jgi:endonuclease G